MELEVIKSSYGYDNFRVNGGKMTEGMLTFLKEAGYRWSRNNNCWYPATAEAKTGNKDFAEEFQKQFFDGQQKSFAQKLIERENKKEEWQKTHGVENSEQQIADERTVQLETLIAELRAEIQRDKEKIARLENELTQKQEAETSREMEVEQEQINSDYEWEKENTLTDEEENQIVNEEISVTQEELEIAKVVLPKAQYATTLRLAGESEEADFFKQKIKDIASVVKNAPEMGKTGGMDINPEIILRYFHPTGTEVYITEIGKGGDAYGFQCLNGDWQMAEWGSLDLNEITAISGMEVDYHVPVGMTVERYLGEHYPEDFPQWAKNTDDRHVSVAEQTPFDAAQKTGNDIEAVAAALKNQTPATEQPRITFTQTPVTLEKILNQMDLHSETTPEGKIRVFDDQLDKYRTGYNDDDETIFNNATEIFDSLDAFINDYFISDMQEQLEENGVNISNAESLEDLCNLYIKEIESGNTNLSEDELNMALGIVYPDTVIMPEIEQKKTQTAEKPTETPAQHRTRKQLSGTREQCKEILSKPDSEITEADKKILAQYEGAGGLNEENRSVNGVLNEFYTPQNLIEKVWKLADAYAPNAKTVLEPSSGIGKFAVNRPNNEFTLHEIDETSARIAKILHPDANVIQGAYQKQFFDDGERARKTDFVQPKYDLVIGNPPYGKYNDKYKGLGEGKEFDRYEEYFISKGLDALKDENSLLAFVVPSGFLNSASDRQKQIISEQGKLLDAYRLPEGTFGTTKVGTDILIMQQRQHGWNREEVNETYNQLAANSTKNWFALHPEKILGQTVEYTDRFGKKATKVVPHDGLTVQDELNKIDGFAEEIAKKNVQQEQITQQENNFKLSTNAYLDFFVKSTAEFDQFADFEPILNLGAKEAVEKYKELQEKGVFCGIGLDIHNDFVFDDREGNGAVIFSRMDGKDTFFMGDSFVKDLKKADQHSLDVVLAFEGIASEAKKQGLNIDDVSFIEDKKQKLFGNLPRETLVNGDVVVNSETLKEMERNTATNYVLEKLKAAGIEVVTDKEEFNRILEQEKNLQKMAELTPEEKERYFTFDAEDTKRFIERVEKIKGYEQKQTPTQFMNTDNGFVYGFTHNGKIYLDPDIMNSNAAVHEYTHLWDAYTERTNPELWEKGKEIFKQTHLWNEVKNDPAYSDIANDDNLVLSECHARVCGKIAQQVLERIAKEDGKIAEEKAIDWDKECWNYIASEIGFTPTFDKMPQIKVEEFKEFFSSPMKDLMNGKNITLETEIQQTESQEPKILQEYEKTFSDNLEKGKKLAQKFTTALQTRNYHELACCVLWGSDKEKAVSRKLLEEIEGEKIPDDYKLAEMWLAKRADAETVPEQCKFTSREDVVSYIAKHGSGFQNGKERIEEFFTENQSAQERAKFIAHEYGDSWYGVGTIAFDMSCTPKNIKFTAFITQPLLNSVEKIEDTLSYSELAKEIDRQIKLGIYNKKEEKPHLQKPEPQEPQNIEPETPSVSPNPTVPFPELKKGDIMTAEQFSHLYGKDFDEREFPIWKATDWKGDIDFIKLDNDSWEYLKSDKNFVEYDAGKWTHKVLFASGDIYAKIQRQKELLESADNDEDKALFEGNIKILESAQKEKMPMEKIHFGLQTKLAEEFTVTQRDESGLETQLNLQESFILWAQNKTLETQDGRWNIDWATANISREELPENIYWSDIVNYIDGTPVKAERMTWWDKRNKDDEEIDAIKAEHKKEADEKRQARSDTADKLFDRYLHEGLDDETRIRLEAEYNRRFNSYIAPDYSKLPLFVDGMSVYKGNDKFKLYEQQIKGISFLCNKGNGLLAYDVGVGKTAAGIVATENQLQTGRSKRPLIVVPNQVYTKWYNDIRELFPNRKVNDLYNFNKESVAKYIDSENPHKLNIPEGSISLCTYEALKNITFTDKSCENELFEDFSSLLSADMDGTANENAQTIQKIQDAIGSASHVKDATYYFYEDCGFDNLTVDEAHHFKNLWTIPRPKKKGQSNEFAGIPSGKPSARALKMYGMTQLTQRHNDDRNVFMLTATPFTNSPLEVYSMLSYIGRERLKEAGIDTLRDFLNEFAKTKQELAVTASGNIDTRQVMKNWKELPALQSILTEFIDKVDGEEAGIIRPNKFTHVKPLDMSPLQKQMYEIDEERMEEIKEGNSAAVIVAMNNMRLACVAPALANPAMYPNINLPPLEKLVETSPKLKFVCDAIIDMYKDNPEKGQFMYLPLGKESHGIIKDYLVSHGIPKNAVEIINGEVNNTPEKKEKVSSKFNDEKDPLKIIIGGLNTSEGIDLNGNSFVMYNCSLGWNPSETIQAEGRIWRQGNLQGNVHVVYPVMNDSIDSVLYQKHDEKRSRINELWNYKGDSLNVEDINPEDLKIELIKDPEKRAKLILKEETKEVKSELARLNLKIDSFDDIVSKRKELLQEKENAESSIAGCEKMSKDYKSRSLEIPTWVKTTIEHDKKELLKTNKTLEKITEKFEKLGIHNADDEAEYIRKLNAQKHAAEEKEASIKLRLPEIIAEEKVKQMERKVTEYPVEKQREILEADILNNLRPMSEVEYEIKTERFNKMIEKKLEAGDITQEERDLYKSAGYKKYEDWQEGKIQSLTETSAEEKTAEPPKTEPVQKEIDRHVSVEKEQSKPVTVPTDSQFNSLYNDEGSLFFGLNDMVVASSMQPYFNARNDDVYLTPEQLTKAEQKRDEIIFPILNGNEIGMYKAFNDFAKHGVFDVQGKKVEISKDGGITPDGWEQLQAAMSIYRSKEFETMRYVLIDRHTGEIQDQLAVSSHMPNVCSVANPKGETVNQVLSRAKALDCMVALVHNHPSGNITESRLDFEFTKAFEEKCCKTLGENRFAGHIILDHDNFNLYTPEKGWGEKIDWNNIYKEDSLVNKNFAFTDERTGTTASLSKVAQKINDVNNWNDDFIPVVFANSQNEVTGIKLYDKSFFNKTPEQIRNEFQFSGIEAGAVSAYPVVTEAFMKKQSVIDGMFFEEQMKNLVDRSAFTDVALPESTVVEKYGIKPGFPFFSEMDWRAKNPEISATWETRINPSLFHENKFDEREKEFFQQQQPQLKKAVGMEY